MQGARALFLTALLLAGAGVTQAQNNKPTFTGNGADNLDWKEAPVPPAPAFSKDQWLKLDMPPYVSVKVGIDPNTVQVGEDGVVRYVAVMTNSTGTLNAVYEGIRCATDEVKTYARFGSSGQWAPISEPIWKPVNGSAPSRHAFVFAREAACPGRLAGTRDEIIRFLKQPGTSKSKVPIG